MIYDYNQGTVIVFFISFSQIFVFLGNDPRIWIFDEGYFILVDKKGALQNCGAKISMAFL